MHLDMLAVEEQDGHAGIGEEEGNGEGDEKGNEEGNEDGNEEKEKKEEGEEGEEGERERELEGVAAAPRDFL
jgi:hypothetical protein